MKKNTNIVFFFRVGGRFLSVKPHNSQLKILQSEALEKRKKCKNKVVILVEDSLEDLATSETLEIRSDSVEGKSVGVK